MKSQFSGSNGGLTEVEEEIKGCESNGNPLKNLEGNKGVKMGVRIFSV